MPRPRALHDEGPLANYMLVPYTMALTMSATMALVTCLVVFKWATVWRHPHHGALFMFFLCTALWSAVTFVGCIARYLNDRHENWHKGSIKYPFLIGQTLQLGSALWLIVAVHEIQRLVFRPRTLHNGRRMMRWFTLGIYSGLFLYGGCLMLFVLLKSRKWDAAADMNSTARAAWKKQQNTTGWNGHADEINFFTSLKWLHSGARMVSVFYPIGMSVYFYRHRYHVDDITGTDHSKVSHRQVQLIGLMSAVVTVPVCLVDTGTTTFAGFAQVANALYYLSGTVSSFALGLCLPKFDRMLKSASRRGQEHLDARLETEPALFSSSSSNGTDIFILETMREQALLR